jgi:TolB-like protein
MASGKHSFLGELKRRNVFRAGIAYIVGGGLVLQFFDLVGSAAGLPDWITRAILILLAIGLPLLLLFSWAFEVTPDGLRKTGDVDPDTSTTTQTAKKLDVITIGAVVLLVGIILARPYLGIATPEADSELAAVEKPGEVSAISEASIAVLPFVNLSSDKEQDYFSDGLSEELLNVLSQVPQLKVAGRTSSFAFKGQNQDLVTIGEALRVAHILEGSVRKSGNRIRITAQLIKTDAGFHLWSQTFDREIDDIFAIQDEIANRILLALKEIMIGEVPVIAVARPNLDAYDLVLLAKQKIITYQPDKMEEAIVHLDEAIALDPDYAEAYFQRARVENLSSNGPGGHGNHPRDEVAVAAKAFLDKGFALQPNAPSGLAELADLYMDQGDFDKAEAIYKRVAPIQPNLVLNNYAMLLLRQNRVREATPLLERVAKSNPLGQVVRANLISQYLSLGRVDDAKAELASWEPYVTEDQQLFLARAKAGI